LHIQETATIQTTGVIGIIVPDAQEIKPQQLTNPITKP